MKDLKKFLYLFTVFLGIVFSGKTLNLLADYFWFKAVGYDPVFMTILTTKFSVWFSFALLFTGFFYANVFWARFANKKPSEWTIRLVKGHEVQQVSLKQRTVNLTLLVISVVLGIIMGILALPAWLKILRFLNQTPFDITDPLFQQDVGFYVFSLPVYRFLISWGFLAVFATLIGVGIVYVKENLLPSQNWKLTSPLSRNGLFTDKFVLPVQVKFHLSLLFGFLLLLYAAQTRLDMFELLYSRQGVVFGASYTDVNAQMWVQWLTIILTIATTGIFWATSRSTRWKPALTGLGIMLLVQVLLGQIYPVIVQRFLVEPNELEKEKPYITNHINFTRKAYNIDQIEEKDFVADDSLDIADVERETPTIRNIKLWDRKHLKLTYREIQEMRLYYNFLSVDVDRYQLDGRLTQVMLSPREIAPELLPQEAQTWEKIHLQFTHGHGVVMSPVNYVTADGLPHLIIKDIPPVSKTSLEITQPEIYYGEKSQEYVIVKTTTPEFDYPKGDKNVYSNYKGIGGVRLNTFLTKLLYAWEESDPQIFLSSYVTSQSRILLRRNIRERINAIAPFLDYDHDPYLVLSEGKLYWIMDGYTTSNRYPYSEPSTTSYLNYIRNPVKVVVDAYNGSVYFYLIDPTDPIIQTYHKIFPGVFKPFDQMPEDLRRHIRYPKDLFEIQCRMYQTYHMRDEAVFYNRADQWAIPQETYREQEMRSYYMIMRLPGEKREEFLLFLPFTPKNKNNMIAWMGARCDGEEYGKLIVYKFPQGKLIYGPQQIEARINQNAKISKELALWGQQGSQVIHGDLLIIPLKQSLLYVKPLYLQAGKNQIPEIKRIIVAHGNRIVMRENLYSALIEVFGGKLNLKEAIGISVSSKVTGRIIKEMAIKAYQRFTLAEALLKEGQWAEWGKVMEEVRNLLKKMQEQSVPRKSHPAAGK